MLNYFNLYYYIYIMLVLQDELCAIDYHLYAMLITTDSIFFFSHFFFLCVCVCAQNSLI